MNQKVKEPKSDKEVKLVKPPNVKIKEPDVDKLRNKVLAGKRPSRARCITVLAALELVRGESADGALARRGLMRA